MRAPRSHNDDFLARSSNADSVAHHVRFDVVVALVLRRLLTSAAIVVAVHIASEFFYRGGFVAIIANLPVHLVRGGDVAALDLESQGSNFST